MRGEKVYLYWAAQLSLRGISRAEAAKALHLSTSAFNKRLRGETSLSKKEEEWLSALLGKERPR